MALEYRLEYAYDDKSPNDANVFIHLRNNPPVYMSRTDKEDYDSLSSEQKHPFLTSLFNIEGVLEISVKAYRIWVMKAPSFDWSEVNTGILDVLKEEFGEDSVSQMPASGNIDGTGFMLPQGSQRRRI